MSRTWIHYDLKKIVDIFFNDPLPKDTRLTKNDYHTQIKDEILWIYSELKSLTSELLLDYLEQLINTKESNIDGNMLKYLQYNKTKRLLIITEKIGDNCYRGISIGQYTKDLKIIPMLKHVNYPATNVELNKVFSHPADNSYYIEDLNKHSNIIIYVSNSYGYMIVHSNGFVYLKISIFDRFLTIEYYHNNISRKIRINKLYNILSLNNKIDGKLYGNQIFDNGAHYLSQDTYISLAFNAEKIDKCNLIKDLTIKANDHYHYEYDKPITPIFNGLSGVIQDNQRIDINKLLAIWNKRKNIDLIISIDRFILDPYFIDNIFDYKGGRNNIFDHFFDEFDDHIIGKCKIEVIVDKAIKFIENKNYNNDCLIDGAQRRYTDNKSEEIGKGEINDCFGSLKYCIQRYYYNNKEISVSKVHKIEKQLLKYIKVKVVCQIIKDYIF